MPCCHRLVLLPFLSNDEAGYVFAVYARAAVATWTTVADFIFMLGAAPAGSSGTMCSLSKGASPYGAPSLNVTAGAPSAPLLQTGLRREMVIQ